MPGIVTSRTRRIYQRPPTGPVCLNRGSTLAGGLLAWWPLNERSAYQVMERAVGDDAAGPVFKASPPSWESQGLLCNGSAEGAEITCPSWLRINPPLSIIAHCIPVADITDTYTDFCGVTHNNSDSSPYQSYGFGCDSLFNLGLQLNNGTTHQPVYSSVSANGRTGEIESHVGVIVDGSQTLYLNGVSIATGSTSVSTLAYDSSALLYIGAKSPNSRNSQREWLQMAVWTRALTDSEVRAFTDPARRWELYYPLGRRVWSFPTAISSGTGNRRRRLLICGGG